MPGRHRAEADGSFQASGGCAWHRSRAALAPGKRLGPGEERSKDQILPGSEVPTPAQAAALAPVSLWLLRRRARVSDPVSPGGRGAHCGHRPGIGAGSFGEVALPSPGSRWRFPVPQASSRSGRCVWASWPSGRCTPASTWP